MSNDKDLTELFAQSAEDTLKNNGIYYITGEITEGSLVEISQDILLKHLDPEWQQDIMLIVNSCGGALDEGWMLIDLLDYVRMDVTTLGLGACSSLGAMLVAAGTIGKRNIARRTTLMTHQAQFYGLGGNLQTLNREMKVVKQEYEKVIQFWLEKSRYTDEEDIKKYIVPEQDVFMTPVEALGHGIADGITTHKPAKTRTTAKPEVKTPTKKTTRKKMPAKKK